MHELSKSEGYVGNISHQSVGKTLFLLRMAEKRIWFSMEDIFLLKGNAYVYSLTISHV
jgi:hypothetical protein